MKVPTNYTLGDIETYSSGGGFYHAQCPIELSDYNGYTGPAYLFITIPDYAEELQLLVADQDDMSIPDLSNEGILGEFYKQDLRNTQFAEVYIDMLIALNNAFGYTQTIWLSSPITSGEETEVSISEFIDYLQEYFGFVPKSTISSSTKHRYMANMVSASDNYESYGDKYYVAGYYDSIMRGLDDDLFTDDFDAAIDFAHQLASSGDYIKIKNTYTGKSIVFDADNWMEAIDFGGVPSEVYSIL